MRDQQRSSDWLWQLFKRTVEANDVDRADRVNRNVDRRRRRPERVEIGWENIQRGSRNNPSEFSKDRDRRGSTKNEHAARKSDKLEEDQCRHHGGPRKKSGEWDKSEGWGKSQANSGLNQSSSRFNTSFSSFESAARAEPVFDVGESGSEKWQRASQRWTIWASFYGCSSETLK
jgi:hypothetical protein